MRLKKGKQNYKIRGSFGVKEVLIHSRKYIYHLRQIHHWDNPIIHKNDGEPEVFKYLGGEIIIYPIPDKNYKCEVTFFKLEVC